jgi:AcrR family transcriptional regulator
MNSRFISGMGRIAGVSAAEIRDRLLRAAAEVFAARGYEGTRVADIAAAAGVSNGALYSHFDGKADLLAQAVRKHGPRGLADLVRADPDRPIADLLLAAGRRLPKRGDAAGALIVEALVAARRDPEVARVLRAHLAERADWVADLVGAGQLAGELDEAVAPAAVAHFCLLLAMGSALIPTDLHGVDADDWDRLLRRVVAALAVPGTAEPATAVSTVKGVPSG